jgi:hypothetical protein
MRAKTNVPTNEFQNYLNQWCLNLLCVCLSVLCASAVNLS